MHNEKEKKRNTITYRKRGFCYLKKTKIATGSICNASGGKVTQINVLVNSMASNCTNRVKYVDDTTVMEFVPRLSPSYLNFTVLDIYSFASSRGMVLNGKKSKEMCISFLQYCPFPPAPLLVGSSLIDRFPVTSC